jgi:hypothetical protein
MSFSLFLPKFSCMRTLFRDCLIKRATDKYVLGEATTKTAYFAALDVEHGHTVIDEVFRNTVIVLGFDLEHIPMDRFDRVSLDGMNRVLVLRCLARPQLERVVHLGFL